MQRKGKIRAGIVTAALVVPLCAVSMSAFGVETDSGNFVQRMEEKFGEIEKQYRPEVRWWLAEGLNTDDTIKKNIQEIDDSGFGAVEILAMPEAGAPSEIYGWGSEEWTSDSRLVISEATKRGLGFSLTSGTHWATANLPDTYEWDGAKFDLDNPAAMQELDYGTLLVKGGDTFEGTLPMPPLTTNARNAKKFSFQGAVAAKLTKVRPSSGQDFEFREGTGFGELDLDSLTDISDQTVKDGDNVSLKWTAPDDGQYAIFAYWMHGSGQTAEPSVSTNYAINYVDPDGVNAMKDYWSANIFTPDLLDEIRENGRGQIYMDSLETNSTATAGLMWGKTFLDEFQARRGYSLTPYLPIVTWDRARHDSNVPPVYDYEPADAADSGLVAKIRNDLNQTFSELYEGNVLQPLQSYLHENGMTLRAEPSYGMQFEISTPAKYLDGVETETFAHNGDLDVYRGLLGSAHMYDRLLSSETGAVGGRTYYYDMDHWTQISYLQFAGGVSRTVFHGYSGIEGSEPTTYWPGHEGMSVTFSDRFNSRQPASAYYPEWTEMLGRNQKVLRQGQAQRDIAILRTDNRFISYGQPRTNTPPENNYFMNDMPYFWKDLSLQQNGFTYDYFSPQLLEDEDNVKWNSEELQPDGPAYRAIVLYQDSLELDAAKRLLTIAKDGIPVLFVNNTSEIREHSGPEIQHEKAAAKARFVGDDEAELASVVNQIKALPNARELDDQSETLATLQDMGVEPRVQYAQANNKIMSISRLDKEENVLYTFVHSFKFLKDQNDPESTFTLELEGAGKPYVIDDWTGKVKPVAVFDNADGRTAVNVTLKPGEARIIALDLGDPDAKAKVVTTDASTVIELDGQPAILAEETGEYTTEMADGKQVHSNISVPETISIPKWDLSIEDWDEGEQKINIEEKFGHETREAYFTTKKTELSFPNTDLIPWKDLPATAEQLSSLSGDSPAMDQVSGMGTYKASFVVPDQWQDNNGAYLRIGSTNGDLAQITVNGKVVPGLDLRTGKIDISEAVKAGENDIQITVATTLTNRMLARGYRTMGPAQDYGITGGVEVIPYTVEALETQPVTTTVTMRVVAGKVYVAISAKNNGSVPADIQIETPYGKKAFTQVAPGKAASVAFNTRLTSIPAGEAKVTSTTIVGGETKTNETAVPIDAFDANK